MVNFNGDRKHELLFRIIIFSKDNSRYIISLAFFTGIAEACKGYPWNYGMVNMLRGARREELSTNE